MRIGLVSLAAMAVLSSSVLVAGDLPVGGEVIPPPMSEQRTDVGTPPPWELYDEELDSHLSSFLRAGYQDISWETWGKDRANVEQNLLGPDFKRRTGNELPENPSFDYALLNLTGGDFNDVIVSSRLPGDCIESGCLVTVFKMVANDEWKVATSFHSLAVAHRQAREGTGSELVAVGDDVFPSIILKWEEGSFRAR